MLWVVLLHVQVGLPSTAALSAVNLLARGAGAPGAACAGQTTQPSGAQVRSA